MNISLIILCAGESSRLKLPIKKQWLRVGNKPLWVYVLEKIQKLYDFGEIIVVGHSSEVKYMANFVSSNVKIVAGGESRQESIKNALSVASGAYVCIHDSARVCIGKKVFNRLLNAMSETISCVAPYLNVSDTVLYEDKYLNRDKVKLIQTPQISKYDILSKAINDTNDFTDESSLINSIGAKVSYVLGSKKLHKITFAKDILEIKCLKKYFKNTNILSKIGFGVDIHKFIDNKKMVLAGVQIPVEYGFLAHSDGDVLIHSLIDAILGAIGAGDIGEFFPDNDDKYKDMDSQVFLKQINLFMHNVGFEIANIDISIVAQQPKIDPYKMQMKKSLSAILQISKHCINIKATTSEKMGYIGKKEGICVYSVVQLRHIDIQDML